MFWGFWVVAVALGCVVVALVWCFVAGLFGLTVGAFVRVVLLVCGLGLGICLCVWVLWGVVLVDFKWLDCGLGLVLVV